VRRGSVYWINLGTSLPPEFGKTRPCLIVSNSAQNEILDSVVVVPLSTNPGEIWPLRIKADVIDSKPSFAVLPGIRQVSKTRLIEYVAPASREFIGRMDRAISIYLND
jgi:mRNA interferase MazF